MKTLNYKKMLNDIDKLVNNDYCAELELKTIPKIQEFTQKEAQQMIQIIGRVYLISHCIHCKACQRKYLLTPPK